MLDTLRYTITVGLNEFYNPSEATIMQGLRNILQGQGTAYIDRVDRGLFSGRYVITFRPMIVQSEDAWIEAFLGSLYSMGYREAEFIELRAGSESSQPGGLGQTLTGATGDLQKILILVAVIAGAWAVAQVFD